MSGKECHSVASVYFDHLSRDEDCAVCEIRNVMTSLSDVPDL